MPEGSEIDQQKELARRLREAREFANLSQKFVADETGIPRSAISDIERGERGVGSLELKRLAELYRLPISYFLSDPAVERSSTSEDHVLLALARAASEMTDEEKQEVLRFTLFLQNFERKTSGP